MVYLIFSLILFPYANCVVEDLFGFNVDELFRTAIGPVYKVRRTGHTTPTYPFDGINFTRTTHPGVTAFSMYQNYSEDPQLKKKIDLECILKDEISGKPNFEEDEIQILSRRFDKVLEGDKNKTDKPVLRELYSYFDDPRMVRHAKYMVYILMQHFLYQTRYKMPYAQKMRAEYIPRIRYKIGFAFSLLRILKTKQYVLYSVMIRNENIYNYLTEFLKLFEKVIRLDLEIKELILFIKNLDRQRIAQFAAARIRLNKIRDDKNKEKEKEKE